MSKLYDAISHFLVTLDVPEKEKRDILKAVFERKKLTQIFSLREPPAAVKVLQ